MKKWLYALAFLLLAASAGAVAGADEAQLRYDGVYQSVNQYPAGNVSYRYYLRFYPDGEVYDASADTPAETVYTWLVKDTPATGIGHGRYKLAGKRVAFSITTGGGVLDYAGEMVGNRIHFEVLSHINGRRVSLDFEFVPVPAPAAK